jgi:ParB family chromosome partitioning protein
MIFHEILRYDFSVRKVEDVVRELSSETVKTPTKKSKVSADIKKTQEIVGKKLECKADIKKNADGKGKITLLFENEEEYNRLITKLTKK